MTVPAVILRLFLLFLALHSASCRNDSSWISNEDIDELLSRARLSSTLEVFAGKPHPAGSPANHAIGDEILRRLQSAGFQTQVFPFSASLPRAEESALVIVSPDQQELALREVALTGDPYSESASDHIPYFAYVPDFDTEAEVIYANFGEKVDYEYLRQQGIDPAGKIALVRAQGICRSMKAAIAKEEGLAGLLLFPELRDQGFRKTAFPDGPHINTSTVQRGSMLQYFRFPGDPDRSPLSDVLPGIAALPISQQSALEIIRRMAGTAVPQNWQGWLASEYRLGPGPVRVRMKFRSVRRKASLRNIIATFPASDAGAVSILAGSHYDAWVYGATDPASGAAVLLESAEILGAMYKQGWRPRRNIAFGFWDAEEFGMLGSTGWVRANRDSARRIGAYINIDSAIRARDFVGYIVPGLRTALDSVLQQVNDPGTERPLFDLRGEYDLPGFSSDVAPFLGLQGIPSAEIRFGRAYSLYHSAYDDLSWFTRFADPDLRYTQALTRIVVLYVQELSARQIIPYRFSEIADAALAWSAHHPAAGLSPQFDHFATIAVRVDRLAEQAQLSVESAARVDDIYLQAMRKLLVRGNDPDVPPGENTILLGPSPETGCGAALFPSAQKPLLSGVNEISQSFSEARELLQKAETVLSAN